MKKIVFLIALFLFSTQLYAKKRTIIVVDKKTQEELIAAKITVNDTTYYTDFNGVIVIDVPDNSNIIVEYPSYESKEVVVDESQVIELNSK